MNRTLRVASVQFNIALGEVERNLEKAVAGLRRVATAGAKLAVLPEMWSTGYDYKRLAELAAETPHVVETLQALTAELGMVTVGSLAERQGDSIFNTAYVIDQGKVVGTYRKLHLFSTMGEDRFLAGRRPLSGGGHHCRPTGRGNLLRSAFSRTLPQAGAGGGGDRLPAGGMAETTPGSLADAAAGAGDRKPAFCRCR